MKKLMVNYWSSYKRKFVNIEKAVYNVEVNQLLTTHYHYLHSLLVKSEQDEDTFNDTYLKLTYSYNSDQDFVEQFKHQFYNLRYAYEQDDKVANYYMQLGEVYDKAEDSFSEEPIELDTTLEAPEDKPSMQNLKEKVQAYAISKKAYKRANKKD